MSELGPIQLEEKHEGVFLGRDYAKSRDFSDQVALEIDKEVSKILEECYEKAKKLLSKHETLVLLIADALMKYETLTKEQIDHIVETGKISDIEETTDKTKEKVEDTKDKDSKEETNEKKSKKDNKKESKKDSE